MATGRICPRCFTDVVLVCPCRTSAASVSAFKRPRAAAVSPPPPPAVTSKSSTSLVGTCTSLEKAYVRPSSAPQMMNVRPVEVLQKSFIACISKPKAELSYISDQLKSIRQDLTVQHIDSDFAATVYEYHARVCLLLKHLPEFGQCLNNVHALHVKGFAGERKALSSSIAEINPPGTGSAGASVACTSEVEFAAFRIAYTGLMSKFEDELAVELASLERNPAFLWDAVLVQYALKAVNCRHNPPLYFSLVASAPTRGLKLLLELFIPKLRIDWLRTLVNGVDEFVSAERLGKWLGMSAEEATTMFEPVVGSIWKGGVALRSGRAKLNAYIQEVTQQRVVAQ